MSEKDSKETAITSMIAAVPNRLIDYININ